MQKEALIIGINDYKHLPPLEKCLNDANDLSDFLSKCGFTTSVLQNPTQKEVINEVANFKKKIKDNTISVIYFSGHGLQVDGDNFIVPVDPNITIAEEIPYMCIHASDLLIASDVKSQNMHLLILDACRNNPFKSGIKGISGGLAKMDAPLGTLIAYSTAANTTSIERAADRNGIYTKFLLESLAIPNLSVEQVFKNTRTNVISSTEGRQVPWDLSSLHGENFSFIASDQVDVPFEEIIRVWENEFAEILLPDLLRFLHSEYLQTLSVEKLHFLFSLTVIAFEKEQAGMSKKTIDEDFLNEELIDKFYPILQNKIIDENKPGEFDILKDIAIVKEFNYGFNFIESPDESFPQIILNEINYNNLSGILSFFVSTNDGEYITYPTVFLKDSGLVIIKFGLIKGKEAEKILDDYFKLRQPFEKEPPNFDNLFTTGEINDEEFDKFFNPEK